MKSIGFIGAESLHSVYFGEVLSSGVPGLNSSGGRLWAPDMPDIAAMRLVQAELAESCASLNELLRKSDAVMILLRNGKAHRELAESCLRAGKPVFVDKPFACSPEDAQSMVDASRQYAVPIMGGSTLCWLPETEHVASLAGEAEEICISFPADWYSPFGGWYYYGSHLTDLCAHIAGTAAISVSAERRESAVEAEVSYPGLRMRLCSAPEMKALSFDIRFKSSKSRSLTVPDYERCYRLGMERFSRMLKTGRSVNTDELVFSTRLLHHIVQTLSDGEAETSGFVG